MFFFFCDNVNGNKYYIVFILNNIIWELEDFNICFNDNIGS